MIDSDCLFCHYLAHTADQQNKAFKPHVNLSGPNASEQPPPYDTNSYAVGVLAITCKVCQTSIPIKDKLNQLVVRCDRCLEATVIVITQ